MKRKFSYSCIIGIIVFLLMNGTSTKLQAQTTQPVNFNLELSYPFNTHYYFHKYPINPAYIGEEGEANMGIGYKKANGFRQTAGNRAFAYVHGKSDAMKGGGFGVLFNYMDANNPNYNYTQMSLGATATYNQSLMDLVDVKIGVTTSFLRFKSGQIPTGTPTLEKFAKLNLDAGVLFALADFELGVALHHNNEPQFQYSVRSSDIERFRREIFITANYNWAISDEFSIKPDLMIQQNSHRKNLLIQLSLLASYQDMFFAGFAYVDDFDANRNPLSNYTTTEFHKFRVTGAAKLAGQFLIAASVDFATNDAYKMQFETSLGYYFTRDDY